MSDEETRFEDLLQRARGGCARSLGRLLDAYRRHLALTARRTLDPVLGRKLGPSDLVQETLLRAGKEFPAFHGKTEHEFAAWLGAIQRNLAANFAHQFRETQKRALGRELWLDQGDSTGDLRERLVIDTPTPGARAVDREERERLEAAIADLPAEYRAVIQLRDFESRSWDEIGRTLDRAPNAARALWYRAIERLREALEAASAPLEP